MDQNTCMFHQRIMQNGNAFCSKNNQSILRVHGKHANTSAILKWDVTNNGNSSPPKLLGLLQNLQGKPIPGFTIPMIPISSIGSQTTLWCFFRTLSSAKLFMDQISDVIQKGSFQKLIYLLFLVHSIHLIVLFSLCPMV